MKPILEKIKLLVEEGRQLENETLVLRWEQKVKLLLSELLGKQTADDFWRIVDEDVFLRLEKQLAFLEAKSIKMEMEIQGDNKPTPDPKLSSTSSFSSPPLVTHSKSVFIVHGHDNEIKETVARFIENIGLEPIILHEQASKGRTIIEKFEIYADVPYAIVLLTPDDFGGVKGSDKTSPRARQNVIFELGYFTGKIGRGHVCALFRDNVEIPSDYQGVLYIKFDPEGAWKTKIAQEMVQSGLPIKLDGLLK